ncbi:MAG: hypothetical protein HY881_13365 [Deltaproteobacteria bacterium]|nr:hypothetical protein [Deltaproteobacteria bacterium]
MKDTFVIENVIQVISESVRDSSGLKNFLTRIIPSIKEMTKSDAISIFLTDHSENSLFLVASSGFMSNPPLNELVYKFGEGLTGMVAKNKSTIYATNLDSSSLYENRKAEINVMTPKSFLAVPIIWFDQQAYGVIRCIFLKKICKATLEKKTKNLQLFSSLIAPFIVAVRSEEDRLTSIERVTHELKSSLVAIKNSIQMLKRSEENLSDKSYHRIDDIITICDMLMTSVESKSLSIGKTLILHRINILLYRDIIMPIANMMLSSLKQKNLVFAVTSRVRNSSPISIDPHLFRLVIFNLFDNALKYAKENSNITIDVQEDADSLELLFSNYGLAISSDESERIFSIGYRSSSAIRKNVVGQGQGLYICRWIVESHGGTISITNLSDPTTFKITLPLNINVESDK